MAQLKNVASWLCVDIYMAALALDLLTYSTCWNGIRNETKYIYIIYIREDVNHLSTCQRHSWPPRDDIAPNFSGIKLDIIL